MVTQALGTLKPEAGRAFHLPYTPPLRLHTDAPAKERWPILGLWQTAVPLRREEAVTP